MIATAAQNNMRIVVIPAKSREETGQTEKRLKVAAYCRVSTDQEEQESSYEAQIGYYTEKIKNNAEWTLAGIFADMYNQRLIQCSAHVSVEKCLK